MSSDFQRSGGIFARSARLPTILLAVAGVAAGFYLAGPATGPRTEPRPETTGITAAQSNSTSDSAQPAKLPAEDLVEGVSPADRGSRVLAPQLHRFPLTAADIKDTQGAPDIAVDEDGRVHLVWASITGESEQSVLIANSSAGLEGLSSPETVVRSTIAFRSQGNGKKGYPIRIAPHIAAQGKSVYLTWSGAVSDNSTVNMVLVNSTDGCATFSKALCVHEHPQARPTFTGMAIGLQGQIACSWLDGRAKNQHPYAAVRPAGQSEFLPEFKLPGGEDDKGVCPCCPTAAAFAPDGTLFVGFRNLVDGYRDLAIVRLRPSDHQFGDHQFEGPFTVAPPTWEFDGCPHDGPSLVVLNGQLHVAWMDAHTGAQRVYYGRASLADMQFEVQALHPTGLGTQGNPRLYADIQGGLHAVWEESLANEPAADVQAGHQHGPAAIGSGRGIRHALAAPGADDFADAQFMHSVAATYQTRPAITGDAQGQIYVAWCELNQEGKSIVVTSVAGKGAPKLTQRHTR